MEEKHTKPLIPREFINELEQLRAERDQLKVERDRLRKELYQTRFGWPPGHFYSPIPSLKEIHSREQAIFGSIPRTIPGIELNEQEQLGLLHTFAQYYETQPFQATKQEGLRYFFENPSYRYGEAIVLHCMIRYLQPARIIEVGSGYSSCAILDTNERFFDDSISYTLIEPYPDLLRSLIGPGDPDKVEIVEKKLQDVSTDRFSALAKGDILFIDSSHVAKADSDVNHIFFRLLPHISSGVYVHFHDIGYPFEYPKAWIYEGRAWNEAYFLRAFLQYNTSFQVRFFNSFLAYFHADTLAQEMPLCAKNPGRSIWIEKT